MSAKGKKVQKAVVYKRANFHTEVNGQTLKTLLEAALSKRPKEGLMKQRRFIAALVLALAGGIAYAEMINVPCDEFVRVTGKAMACTAIPVIKMTPEQWAREKAAAEDRANRDTPPWERAPKEGQEAEPQETVDLCALPIWMRQQQKCED